MSENANNVYEMLWDCQYCGTEGNLGLTHRFCPNCGAPQNPEARYFPADDEKVAVQDHQYVGVDVTCPNCNALNSAAANFCRQCSAQLDESAVRANLLASRERAEGETFASSGSRDLVKEQFDEEMERIGVAPSTDKKKRGTFSLKRLISLIVLIVAGGGAFAFFNITTETDLVVTGHQWERSIRVETYQNFTVRSWRDSRPPGDNVLMQVGSCRQEQRSTRRVPDGEECTTRQIDQGDGTFRQERVCQTTYRNEPVYDDMCTWTGQRWMTDRTERTNGNSLGDTPTWPTVQLNCVGQRRLGCEREAGRSEEYIVLYAAQDNDNRYQCSLPQTQWATSRLESSWIGEVRLIDSGGLRCDSLQSAANR